MKAIGVILTSGVGARHAVPLRPNKIGACVGAHVSAFAKVGAHGWLLRKVGAHSCAPLQLNEVLAA
jgi:hypothetical protein